jgi:hypothetical protein
MVDAFPITAARNRADLVVRVAAYLHNSNRFDAAKEIAAFSDSDPKKVISEAIALEWCFSLLQWCLDNDHYDWAANMLWTKIQFSYEPACTKLVWENLKGYHAILLQGAASMSKSYGGGVWHFLDWIRDPQYTNVLLVGPSEEHLKANLFSHLVNLHRDASLPMPGIVGDLFIGLDTRNRKGAIRGVVVPIGKQKAGRLQGTKRYPRRKAHSQFGLLSRVRIFLDEFEKIPVGIQKDIDNVLSNFDGDVEGFKITGAYNPEDPNGQVAIRAEPPNGWGEESFNPDRDFVWDSKRGWRVVRLDAKFSENIVSGKTIYPGLQTIAGYNLIIKNAGGLDTPGYWTMCRACFPRSGAVYSVISSLSLNRAKGEFIFAEEPTPCGGVDMALEGGDACEFAVGRYGRASGYRSPPSLANPTGEPVMFFNKEGRRVLRHAVQLDQIIPLPPGDTVKMAMEVKRQAILLHIAPKDLCLDRTGNGAGVHDLLKELWSPEVQAVNYSEAADEEKILEGDTKTAKEEYTHECGSLWFALKKFIEFGFFRALEKVLGEELVRELTGRRYAPGKQNKVEMKEEYKSRGNNSPNKADSVTLMLRAARKSSGMKPSALDDCAGTSIGGSDGRGAVPQRVDCTARFEDLDTDSGDVPAGFDPYS